MITNCVSTLDSSDEYPSKKHKKKKKKKEKHKKKKKKHKREDWERRDKTSKGDDRRER